MTKNLIAQLNVGIPSGNTSIALEIAKIRNTEIAYVESLANCHEISDGIFVHTFDNQTCSIIALADGSFVDCEFNSYTTYNPIVMVEIYTLNDGEIVEPVESEKPVEMLSAKVVSRTVVKHNVCINNGLITKCKELDENEIETLISMNKGIFYRVTVEYGTFEKTMLKTYSQVARLNSYIHGSATSFTITFYTHNEAIVKGF